MSRNLIAHAQIKDGSNRNLDEERGKEDLLARKPAEQQHVQLVAAYKPITNTAKTIPKVLVPI
jgi:hypothetical protein